MDKYYFLYLNATHTWFDCTNPVFIASHQHCRAIPKEIVHDKLGYSMISDLVYDLNNDNLTDKGEWLLAEFDIHTTL